jgi:hypothetical protein
MVDADIKDLEEMKRCQDVIRKLSNNNTVGGKRPDATIGSGMSWV